MMVYSITFQQVIIFLILLILALLLAEKGTRYFLTQLRTAPPLKEFPEITESDLEKFTSFDSELGWERQPNEHRKKDVDHQRPDDPDANTVVYSTDEYGSRVCEIDRTENEFSVATYGDSFCFCREVTDNESFQHYLAQDLGVHVSNYGVGNYGLDQSILRLKRRFEDDPSEYVVLALSDEVVMDRIVCAWKHYFEFGNTFAVKPRYELKNDELEFTPTPIDDRSDLLELKNHRNHLRTHDYHYKNWFIPHLLSRPYLRYWLQDSANLPHALFLSLGKISREINAPEGVQSIIIKGKEKWEAKRKSGKQKRKMEYRYHLRQEFSNLLYELLHEFSMYVRSQGSVPVFLPIRAPSAYQTAHFEPLGEPVIEEIKKECPDLHVVDSREKIADSVDSPAELYVRTNPLDGHPSPYHNQCNAKYLGEFIREHNR